MLTKWIKGKIKINLIILSALIALSSLYFLTINENKSQHPAFTKQVQAAKKMKAAEKVLYQAKIEKSYSINTKLDPNKTALIGKEYTNLTTTLGDLKAKRTATNPDFAALIVKYFHQLNLQKGDQIAVGASGSFPGLILAVLSAAEVMNLDVSLIYSLGSSMYGANIPDFTFIEMLKQLKKENILSTKITALSLGGDNDRADNLFFSENKNTFFKIIKKHNIPLIYEKNLQKSVAKRIEILNGTLKEESFKCFINVGGASANFGNTASSVNFKNGLTIPGDLEAEFTQNGLLSYFLSINIPVIHLLNIENLARKSGIQVDPVPLPKAGKADVYYLIKHNNLIIVFLILLIISPIFFAKFYAFKSRRLDNEN